MQNEQWERTKKLYTPATRIWRCLLQSFVVLLEFSDLSPSRGVLRIKERNESEE